MSGALRLPDPLLVVDRFPAERTARLASDPGLARRVPATFAIIA